MLMIRIDSPRLGFGATALEGDPTDLIDHGPGPDAGLPALSRFVQAVPRAQLRAPAAEAAEPGRSVTWLLWGSPADLREWARLHPGLVVRGRLVTPPADLSDLGIALHRGPGITDGSTGD